VTINRGSAWLFEPEIAWYLFNNTLKLEAKGHYQTQDVQGAESNGISTHNYDWWTIMAMSIYF